MSSSSVATEQQLAGTSVARAEEFWRGLSAFYVQKTQLDDLRTRATGSLFVREAAIRAGDAVLDAGCGHLRISIALTRLVPGVRLTGVDLTQSLLDEGARLLQELHYPPMELVRADLAKVPFEDARFDKVVSARVFQYVSDPVAACRELYRVLKPGGRFVLSVPNRLNPLKRLGYKGRLHAPAELAHWLSEAGFGEVRSGSACFVPGQLGRGWDSAWLAAESVAGLPLIGQAGGNAWASGVKPNVQGR